MQLYSALLTANTKSADIATAPGRRLFLNCSTPVRLMAKNSAPGTATWSPLTVEYYEDHGVAESTSDVVQIWAGDLDSRVTLYDDSLIAVQTDGTSVMTVQERDGVMQADAFSAATSGTQKDCTGFRSVAIQVTANSSFVGTIVAEISNDGSNWNSPAGYAPLNAGATSPSSTVAQTLNSVIQFPTPCRYFRLRCSAYTSGSITFQSFFRSEPIPKLGVYIGGGATSGSSLNIQGLQSGNTSAVGNPVRVAGIARTATPTLYGNGTTTDIITTAYGVQIQKPYSIPELDWSYVPPAGGLANSAATVSIKAAGAAGIRNYITSMNISTDALGAACDLVILDGSTVIYRQRLQTTGIPQGLDIDFPTPLKSTAATALNIQTQVAGTGTAVTGGIYLNVQGYTAP